MMPRSRWENNHQTQFYDPLVPQAGIARASTIETPTVFVNQRLGTAIAPRCSKVTGVVLRPVIDTVTAVVNGVMPFMVWLWECHC